MIHFSRIMDDSSYRSRSRRSKGRKRRVGRASSSVPSLNSTKSFSPELKYVNTTTSIQDMTTTPVITLLNGCAPGSDATNRIGRRVLVKSVQLSGYAAASTATVIAPCRWAIVIDRQPNGATFSFTDCWDTALADTLRNPNNLQRFQIIHDTGVVAVIGSTQPSPAIAATSTSMVPFHLYKKLNVPVQYNSGTAGTIADIQTNAIFLVTWGSQAGLNGADFTSRIRIRFADE